MAEAGFNEDKFAELQGKVMGGHVGLPKLIKITVIVPVDIIKTTDHWNRD